MVSEAQPKAVPPVIGGGSGPEKGAGEGGWEARGNQMSKGGKVDQFHE
jgi:hypothetical protein